MRLRLARLKEEGVCWGERMEGPRLPFVIAQLQAQSDGLQSDLSFQLLKLSRWRIERTRSLSSRLVSVFASQDIEVMRLLVTGRGTRPLGQVLRDESDF